MDLIPVPSCTKLPQGKGVSHISQNERGEEPRAAVPPGLLTLPNPSAGARAVISVGCGQSWGSTSSQQQQFNIRLKFCTTASLSLPSAATPLFKEPNGSTVTPEGGFLSGKGLEGL